MTTIQRQRWERVRAKGRTRYIMLNFLFWGLPMWAIQTFGPCLYDFALHKPYTPSLLILSPAFDLVFDMVLWIFGFGYLMGAVLWGMREKDYQKDDHKA